MAVSYVIDLIRAVLKPDEPTIFEHGPRRTNPRRRTNRVDDRAVSTRCRGAPGLHDGVARISLPGNKAGDGEREPMLG
jgi:hypothetical protein